MQTFNRVNTESLNFKNKTYKTHAMDYNLAADNIVQLEFENEEKEKKIR